MLKSRNAPNLGVHVRDNGVDVSLFAPDATRVEFCLLDKAGESWYQRSFDLTGPRYGYFSGFVEDVHPGQHYGFRVHGPWDPKQGHFFNPAKLLVDPYARAISGDYIYREEVFGYKSKPSSDGGFEPVRVDGELVISDHDSAPFVPHSVVAHNLDDFHPRVEHVDVPWNETIIYEMHVKGFTKNAHWLPENLRGTYAGLGHEKTIEYLQNLGVTTVELLPIHSNVSESHLLRNDLRNYWGYSTLSFFAPNPDYATYESRNNGGNAVVDEVRAMVHNLHQAGIEVILDVVYNHTCEEGNTGPSLCYRGIANQNYYVHPEGMPGELYDTTGCGNTLNFREPHVVRLATQSLQFWATQIGIDGFRFDLMVSTARGENGFSKEHPFLVALKNDAVLGNLKLIAEPWDVGPYGWRTGGFGFPFSEWNDSFRNDMRSFWVSDYGRMKVGWSTASAREIATRIAGSSDIFGKDPMEKLRGPIASINYITAHDGFTLRDLVTYDQKHNDDNKENNQDGTTDNNSFNHGREGETDSNKVNSERRKTMRNMLAMLLLSTGVPMLVAGDEFGRTQFGNNNAYCQDSEISYLNWSHERWQQDLLETTKFLINLKKTLPALQSRKFFTGVKLYENSEFKDINWFDNKGEEFTTETWQNAHHRVCQCLISGPTPNDADVLLIINGTTKKVDVQVPDLKKFERIWNSHNNVPKDREDASKIKAEPFSIQIFTSKNN